MLTTLNTLCVLALITSPRTNRRDAPTAAWLALTACELCALAFVLLVPVVVAGLLMGCAEHTPRASHHTPIYCLRQCSNGEATDTCSELCK